MSNATTATPARVNGLDLEALQSVVRDVSADPSRGIVGFRVKSKWLGQTRSEARVDSYTLGGQSIPRSFTMPVDEPLELLGRNEAPNPQEMLMAALNSCMLCGYVAGATIHGIELESLMIETEGELDLRGFLGIDAKVKPGYDEIHYTVRIKGDGTPEQFAAIHETVMATSPNRFNLANPIKLTADLVVE